MSGLTSESDASPCRPDRLFGLARRPGLGHTLGVPRVRAVRHWGPTVRVWSRRGRVGSLLARVALLGSLIAGLVGMHQLSTGDDCCAPSLPTGVAAVGHWFGQPQPAGLVEHAPVSQAPWSASPSVHDAPAGQGSVADTLCACLALLVTAGGLIALCLWKLGRAPLPTGTVQRRAAPSTAAPRGPPTPQRLAQLQVLRL